MDIAYSLGLDQPSFIVASSVVGTLAVIVLNIVITAFFQRGYRNA